MTNNPMINTNQPNPCCREVGEIRDTRRAPSKDPRIASAVKVSVTGQSILTARMWPPNAAPLFITMANSDVPMAKWMGNPPKSTNAGTMRKPPPAPTKPVTAPTKTPSSAETQSLGVGGSCVWGCFLPLIMVVEVNNMITAKMIIKRYLGTNWALHPPAKAPAMEASPKGSPTLNDTILRRQCGINPTNDVRATTTSEEAMA